MRTTKLLTAVAVCGAAVLAVAVPATAATAAAPGSDCSVGVTGPELGFSVPGTVSADGNQCVPNTPFLSSILKVLNAGAACDTTIVLGQTFVVVVDCPDDFT